MSEFKRPLIVGANAPIGDREMEGIDWYAEASALIDAMIAEDETRETAKPVVPGTVETDEGNVS